MKRAKFSPVNFAELWKKSNQPLSAYVSGVVHRKITNTGRIEIKTNNGKIVSANAPDDETFIPVGMTGRGKLCRFHPTAVSAKQKHRYSHTVTESPKTPQTLIHPAFVGFFHASA